MRVTIWTGYTQTRVVDAHECGVEGLCLADLQGILEERLEEAGNLEEMQETYRVYHPFSLTHVDSGLGLHFGTARECVRIAGGLQEDWNIKVRDNYEALKADLAQARGDGT